ncbi:hypothetical protein M440DRAFT_1394690 [Trichoderma longibrachiatum ATCC 18648]|uniref:Uncharacterized protein n=1 Tax=Trichoderma longibrachiatum ATCC 18648 TaxID=983965 RepID=A0A2T4BU99_TRILO|nr:hypothetical protein M440DRAFT_1394690 [Trichoderma longibrachiatum ATCC 18648]
MQKSGKRHLSIPSPWLLLFAAGQRATNFGTRSFPWSQISGATPDAAIMIISGAKENAAWHAEHFGKIRPIRWATHRAPDDAWCGGQYRGIGVRNQDFVATRTKYWLLMAPDERLHPTAWGLIPHNSSMHKYVVLRTAADPLPPDSEPASGNFDRGGEGCSEAVRTVAAENNIDMMIMRGF